MFLFAIMENEGDEIFRQLGNRLSMKLKFPH